MSLRNLVEEWNAKNGEKYSQEFLDRFIAYWEKDGKWDNQKTFKIGGRLATFSRNDKKYKQKNTINRLKQIAGNTNFFR